MYERPQKIGCYVQKSTVICAVTEDVNLSWEGWQHYRKIEGVASSSMKELPDEILKMTDEKMFE